MYRTLIDTDARSGWRTDHTAAAKTNASRQDRQKFELGTSALQARQQTHLLVTPQLDIFGRSPGGAIPLVLFPAGAMVFGFETAKRTPSSVSPSPSQAHASSVPVLDLDPAAALDDGHAGRAHILSHVTAAVKLETPRAQDTMRSQDGEVEGRPPYLHVGRIRC